MNWLRMSCVLFGGFLATCGHAQSPPLDSSPGYFAGDWIGTGARDNFCFMRLGADGTGTVLAMGGSGDWLGARIRWRNQRQNIVVVSVQPITNDPQRRLAPLTELTLSLGFGSTIHLMLAKDSPACELQRRAGVQRNVDNAELLLSAPPNDARGHGGK
jgi:hypothetical protein